MSLDQRTHNSQSSKTSSRLQMIEMQLISDMDFTSNCQYRKYIEVAHTMKKNVGQASTESSLLFTVGLAIELMTSDFPNECLLLSAAIASGSISKR